MRLDRNDAERDADEVLAANIRSARVAHDLSQAALAERAGLSRDTIYRIEVNRLSPSITVLRRLARALKTPIASLLRKDS